VVAGVCKEAARPNRSCPPGERVKAVQEGQVGRWLGRPTVAWPFALNSQWTMDYPQNNKVALSTACDKGGSMPTTSGWKTRFPSEIIPDFAHYSDGKVT
jgi:hypothetical protein